MELEKKPGRRYSKTLDPQLLARKMKAEGKTNQEVADALGISRSHTTRLITNHKRTPKGPCSKCGRVCDCLQKHHTDYINDTVIAVCPSCHTKIHSSETAPTRSEAKAERVKESIKTGSDLRRQRLEAGIGLRAMASRIGLSHAYLTLLEQGKRNWTAKLIQDFKDSIYDQTT